MKKQLFLILLSLFQFLSAQNQNISNGLVFDGEPFIIANPSNNNHLTVAWMGFSGSKLGIKTKTSFNGGLTWSNAVVLPHFSSTFGSADPSLAYDNQGNLFACYIDYRQNPDSGGVYVIKSSNGGLSWANPTKAIDAYNDNPKRPLDRPWMSINPVNNQIYITSKPAPWIPAPNRPYFVNSLDGGQTWQSQKYLDTTGFLTGNLIQAPMAALTTSSNGTLHCLYPTYVPSQNILPGFIHASSTNGGQSFNYNGAFYLNPTPSSDTLPKKGYNLISNPSNPNHLVFVTLINNTDLDVYIFESFDAGLNWSTPKKVNDDPIGNGKMQDLVWADFDDDGDLVVCWRDRRNAPNSGYETSSEIWAAFRDKDSLNFAPNFPISDSLVAYNAQYLSQNGNDFMCVDLKNDTISTVWGDVRTGVLNIWFSRKSLISGTSSIHLIHSENIPNIEVFPNPTTDILNFKTDKIKIISVKVFDQKGSFIQSFIPQNNEISLNHLISGVYTLKIETSEGIIKKRIVKN